MIIIDAARSNILTHSGLGFYGLGRVLAKDFCFEPPCSLKFAIVEQASALQAFSYMVSGYLCGVEVGRYCSIAENVQIGRQNHPLTWLSTSPFLYLDNRHIIDAAADQFKETILQDQIALTEAPTVLKRTVIKNDVWIGHGAIINAGVIINNGAIIAAGSVVTKEVPAYAIVGGNPAKIIRYRFPLDIIAKLEQIQWWRFSPQQLSKLPINNVVESLAQLEKLALTTEPYTPQKHRIAELLDLH